ncbi:double-strand break repair protein MRE11 [Babesia microti strain RI]|uniref:Double-strand break repair protein MRE11 n=1 Tax=Babesia microti (strain RI) TaxID=1133968 RepID=I7IHA3_BABMR|nr:double-strand break repair protein MRE11 [Babesia microti strain RI]CCF75462.2 double-strand break repair protein MRE11 [Babesia microti strain RI]|eukprot:XP_021337184.1 double-strand break repair protein MRE11 [Babesia microti strain RI]
MVLKKSSFKSVFTNKAPLITSIIQSPNLRLAKNINNESKITDYEPKIRNVSNFHRITSRMDTHSVGSDVNFDKTPPMLSNLPLKVEHENNFTANISSNCIENITCEDVYCYTQNSNEESPDGYSNESLYSQSDSDVFKILIATDSHLGFKDDDMYLADDPINTFHEILYLASKLNVDCIFHSGDLFDQNKPSRTTMYKTMELLNKYCLGANKIAFEVFESSNVMHNDDKSLLLSTKNVFTDKHNVKLPIFIIHGNHDNPSHEKGLSPIDILDVSGLVNYFGKIEDFNHINVKPLLLKKGKTKIALYGLGWIKDERLVRAFQTNKIEFSVPNNLSEWICILLFHQNRYRGSGVSAPVESCIPESYIPDFIDLIIWGHEHESQRAPVKSATKNHRILQLGSSVRTSLIQSETLPKHVALLEVKLDSYKIYPIRLETVRPMIYRDIALKDYDVLPQEKSIWDFLTIMIQNLLSEREVNDDKNVSTDNILTLSTLLSNLKETNNENEFDRIIEKVHSMPLVRVKIDYTGFPTINPKSFGSQFIGKIANPFEIIRFYKRKTQSIKNNGNKTVSDELVNLDLQHIDNKGIFDIIYESVDVTGNKLNFFSEHELNLAVQGFVLGMDSKAISSYVSKYVDEMSSYIANNLSKYIFSDEDMLKFIELKALERANLLRSELENKAQKIGESNEIKGGNNSIYCDEIDSNNLSLCNNMCTIKQIPNVDMGVKRVMGDAISDTVVKKKITFNN